MAYQGNQVVAQTKVISQDYVIDATDRYIGVNSNGPVTITLPSTCPDNTELVIKLEMSIPIDNRMVTLATEDYSSTTNTSIDGDSFYVLNHSYQSVTIISRQGHWFII